ncbi:MAG: DUF4333 domain-containing protein, partial [Actinomycetota bacterium]
MNHARVRLFIALCSGLACTRHHEASGAELERSLAARFVDGGFKVTKLQCPTRLNATPGTTFRCDVEFEGLRSYPWHWTVTAFNATTTLGNYCNHAAG